MNEKARSIFLCPECGGASLAADDGSAICSECEHKFALPKQVAQPEQAQIQISPRLSGLSKPKMGSIQRNISIKSKEGLAPAGQEEPTPEPVRPVQDLEKLQEQKKSKGERRKRLKKRSRPSAKSYLGWVFAWLATVSVVLLVVVKIQETFKVNTGSETSLEDRLAGEELIFFEQEYPDVRKRFQGFLTVKTVGQMADFALDTDQLGRKMTSHYKENSVSHINRQIDPSPVFWNVAFEETPGFVEVVWEAPNATFLEGVFVKKDEEWYLDWEHLVRYSSTSWTYFHQQIGSRRSGNFRVYIEEFSNGEGSNFKPWVKVKLSPPYREEERREREESEVILLDENNPVTAKVIALFSERSGQSKGYSEVWERDPRKLRRAFLELEWIEDKVTGKEELVIKDVLASHWRSLETAIPSADSEETK